MINVLQIAKYFPPDVTGGIETSLRVLLQATHRPDIQQRVFCLSDKPRISEFEGTEIVRLPLSKVIASCPISYRYATRFDEMIEAADVLQFHFPWPFAEVLYARSKIKKPTIVTYHSDILRQKWLKYIYTPYMHRFLKKADVICPTSAIYMESSPVLRHYKEKCHVIPSALHDFSKNKYVADISSTLLSLTEKQDYCLFIGVLRYYKGLHILLNAAKHVNVPIIIAGSGPCETELKAQAARLGLTNVHFVGFVTDDEKYFLLKHCKIVVMPSHVRTEAFGLSLVDGLMFGKPLISAKIQSGTQFVNQNQETGFVVEPDNEVALAEAIAKLYNDDLLYKRMCVAARQRYCDFFTAEKLGESYTNLYRELAN